MFFLEPPSLKFLYFSRDVFLQFVRPEFRITTVVVLIICEYITNDTRSGIRFTECVPLNELEVVLGHSFRDNNGGKMSLH